MGTEDSKVQVQSVLFAPTLLPPTKIKGDNKKESSSSHRSSKEGHRSSSHHSSSSSHHGHHHKEHNSRKSSSSSSHGSSHKDMTKKIKELKDKDLKDLFAATDTIPNHTKKEAKASASE